MPIKLKFINSSQGLDNPEVLIFQKNVVPDLNELAIAWKVIRNCGRGCYHPFTYADYVELSITDSNGNYSPRQKVFNGGQFAVTSTVSGRKLTRVVDTERPNPRDLVVRNQLTLGAIDVCVYHDGELLALKTSVVPGQKALFQFTPTIWIGVVSDVTQGEVVDSAIISSINTELSLVGIASATIEMTGGGPGADAASYAFNLIDVKRA